MTPAPKAIEESDLELLRSAGYEYPEALPPEHRALAARLARERPSPVTAPPAPLRLPDDIPLTDSTPRTSPSQTLPEQGEPNTGTPQSRPPEARTINPSREAQGNIYLPDIVARRRELGDGAKRLYERLVRWAGQNGAVWYGYERMASELGKSVRQVRAAIAELDRQGLIRRIRRGGRQSNRYEFLDHEWFDERRKTAHQTGRMSGGKPPIKDDMSGGEPPVLSGGKQSEDTPLSGGKPPMNYVSRELCKEESSSSSAALPISSSGGNETATLATTTPTFEAEILWWEETAQRREAVELLRGLSHGWEGVRFSAGQPSKWSPETKYLEKLLAVFRDSKDFALFLQDLSDRGVPPRAKGPGLYLNEAKNWPWRRAEVQAQLEAEAAAKASAEQPSMAANPRETPPPPKPALPACGRCSDEGVVGIAPSLEWCDCQAAKGKRERTPGHVEQCNEMAREFQRRFVVNPEPR